MNIRTLLQVGMAAILGGVVAIALLLAHTLWQFAEIRERRLAGDEMSRGIRELALLAQSWRPDAGQRPLVQWSWRYASLKRHIEESGGAFDPRYTAMMAADVEEADATHTKLARLRQARLAEGESGAAEEKERLLSSQLAIRLQYALSHARRLREETIEAEDRLMVTRVLSGGVVVGLVLLIVVGSSVLAMRRLAAPVERLRLGAAEIGMGHLEFRTGLGTPDELGELSRDIDRMAGHLQQLTVSRDELLRTEKDLRESEERFRAMADNIAQLAWMSDKRGRVLWYNRRWLDYTGVPLEEIGGPGCRQLIHPDHVERVSAKLARCFENGETWEDSFPLRGRDGGFRWYLARAVPIGDEGGELASWFGTGTDISDMKEAEGAVQRLNAELEARVAERTARLETANKELKAFSYTAAHDLKTPLRGIEGYSRLLLDDYGDALGEEGRWFAANIQRSASQMNQLINDLLAYASIERREAALHPVDLRALIEGLAAEYRQSDPGGRLQIALDLGVDSVIGDRYGLAQSLRNLLDNAVKYSRDMPQPRLEIGSRAQGERCLLWVRDNGSGFDMKYHDQIFEPFRRLHRPEDFPGTGIGLAIVRKAVGQMHGRVWAESEPGQGASFYLEIPR